MRQNAYDHASSDPKRPLRGVESDPRRSARKPHRALLRRHIDVLYLTYLEKQLDAELLQKITAKSNAVEKAFNVYRPKVNGKELTDSGIRSIPKLARFQRAAGRLGSVEGRQVRLSKKT